MKMVTPPFRRRFSLVVRGLIEQSGFVGFDFPEYCPHQGLTHQATAVRDVIPFAETLQCPLFFLIEQDRDSIVAGSFHR